MSTKKWTVMVYMAAAKDPKLEAAAIRDIREMEGASDIAGANVIVCMDRDWPGGGVYRIEKGESRLIPVPVTPPKLSKQQLAAGCRPVAASPLTGAAFRMGESETLRAFMTLAAEHAPADHYFLVLWGHAYGLGFGRDHGRPLTLANLRDAVDAFNRCHRSGTKLELFGANACALSYAEAAYELRGVVDYLVASETSVPFAGWPYDTILKNMPADATAESLGRLVVDSYVNSFNTSPSGPRVQMSLLDLRKADRLQLLLENLAASIRLATVPTAKADIESFARIRDIFFSTATGDVRPLLDLSELCENLKEIPAIEPEATSLSDFLADERELIRYKQSHPELDNLNGLGVFAPFVTDAADLERLGIADASASHGLPQSAEPGRQEYEALSIFTGDTAPDGLAARNNGTKRKAPWPTLVYDDLRQALPTEIFATIAGTGVTDPAGRADVTQLLVTMDSVFNRFDFIVRDARMEVMKPIASNRRAQSPTDMARFRLLRLFGATSLQTLDKSIGRSARRAPKDGTVAGSPADRVVRQLLRIEKALAAAEKTTAKVLTNERFGLGPPDVKSGGLGIPDVKSGGLGLPDVKSGGLGNSDIPDVKSGALGLPDVKSIGLGLPDVKSIGLGLPDVKSIGLGLDDIKTLAVSLFSSMTTDTPMAMLIVAKLFQQVALSLVELERAAALVESAAAAALLAKPLDRGWTAAERLELSSRPIARAFMLLEQASLKTRRAVLGAVAHPVYGVGPGPENIGGDYRRELAAAGGLNGDNLTLLSSTPDRSDDGPKKRSSKKKKSNKRTNNNTTTKRVMTRKAARVQPRH